MSQIMAAVRRLLHNKIHPDLSDEVEKELSKLEELIDLSDGMFQGYVFREGELIYLTPKAIKMIKEAGI